MSEKDRNVDQEQPHPNALGACRMTGKGVLRDLAKKLRRRADAMDRLADILPEKMTPEDDAALWDLAISLPH